MSDIKAIETVYNGYRFRSRLEARWAVFFDATGIKYEYEPEGFEAESFNDEKYYYLPDFYLPELKTYVEVKPNIDKLLDEKYKLGAMIDFNNTPCADGLLILGQIPFYEEDSCQVPNFIRFKCDKGIVGELVFFDLKSEYTPTGIKITRTININMIAEVEHEADFELPSYASFPICFGDNWKEDFYNLYCFDPPCLRDGIGRWYEMKKVHRKQLSNFYASCFKKARQARFEFGECG